MAHSKAAPQAIPPHKVNSGASKGQEKKRRREESSGSTSHADSGHRPVKKSKASLSIIDLTSEPDLKSTIVNDEPELPAEIGTLKTTYDVTDMSIISSAKIEAKVTRVLETLAKFSFMPVVPPCKPNIIYLHAKAPCASKLVSILEIAKRTIAEKKGKWYQYTQLGEVKEERQREVTNGDAMMIDDDTTADTTDFRFETMKTPFERATEGRPKIRAVPFLGVYLSRVRVESLKKLYG